MATALILVCHSAVWASYGIYVGKNLTGRRQRISGRLRRRAVQSLAGDCARAATMRAGTTIKVGATAVARYPGSANRDSPGRPDLQVHHHELLGVRRLSGAVDQRRAQRASRGGARHLVAVAAGTAQDDTESAARTELQRSVAHRHGARQECARGGGDYRRLDRQVWLRNLRRQFAPVRRPARRLGPDRLRRRARALGRRAARARTTSAFRVPATSARFRLDFRTQPDLHGLGQPDLVRGQAGLVRSEVGPTVQREQGVWRRQAAARSRSTDRGPAAAN